MRPTSALPLCVITVFATLAIANDGPPRAHGGRFPLGHYPEMSMQFVPEDDDESLRGVIDKLILESEQHSVKAATATAAASNTTTA